MSSYHTSFSYIDGKDGKIKNSLKDKNLIIVAFDPDDGFKDTFLSMENISDSYYDGTTRFDYGSKYTSSAEVQITAIKKDGTDMTMKEFREYAQWLTGARVNSWLDMYVGDTLIYSFLGKFINFEQYKYDARTIGFRATFSSVSPWAFSAPQSFNCEIGQALRIIKNRSDAIIDKTDAKTAKLGVDDSGVLYVSYPDTGSKFSLRDDGLLYIDTKYSTTINNESDDVYTYIYLDIEYYNGNNNNTEVYIENKTLDEKTAIRGLDSQEIISLSSKQFIVSYNIDTDGNRVRNIHKIFGDNFNFVWPRLAPGKNDLVVEGSGQGEAKFTYRYPMKIGDCAMDIDINGNSICD